MILSFKTSIICLIITIRMQIVEIHLLSSIETFVTRNSTFSTCNLQLNNKKPSILSKFPLRFYTQEYVTVT